MTVRTSPAQPAVSIIITCYNYESYVAQAIESALGQTFTDLEVIVVDDGSTDRSADVISRYADRIRSIRKENGGFISACQTGLSESNGRFVLFLDADDVLDPNLLAEAAPYLTTRVSKIQFKLQPTDAAGADFGDPFPKSVKGFGSEFLIAEIAKRGCYDTPPTSGNIYRRDVYTQLGSLDYDYGIDGVAYLFAPFVGDVIFLATTLGRYRLHGSNMSSVGSAQPARIRRDNDVFAKRLEHLGQLLEARGDPAQFVKPAGEYQYCLERVVQLRLLAGEKIPMEERFAYLKSIVRERAGAQRYLYLLFGTLAAFLPRKLALDLIAFRNDPAASPRVRSLLAKH